jgi:pyruvate/2-oxoglutarate dehydrogenase complex dihydrolipoamide acyltransferase (E2) component
LCSHPSL